jgi:molybdopterin converting factor small subunit
MTSDDLTVRILTEIRDGIRTTNDRVDQLGERVDHLRADLSQRIDETNERVGRLENRVTEASVQTSTELHAVNATMRDVLVLLRDRLELRDRVDRCERDIEDLKKRVG